MFDPGCPHVEGARAVLARALQEAGAPAVWTEWATDDPACPETRRGLGSPTILVNGEDVAPGPHPWWPREGPERQRCRLYRDGEGLTGVPPQALVLAAVVRALRPDAV